MPLVEIEVMRTRTVTIEESGVIEVNVPKKYLNDDDLFAWVEENVSEDVLSKAMGASHTDEDIEIQEINLLDEQ